jgi:hypothetical protein
MVDTVQNEQNSGQLIDNQAAIQKNLLAMQQAAATSPGVAAAGGGAAGGMTVESARPSSDIDPFLSIGISSSKYAKTAEIVMTGVANSRQNPGNGMMFSGNSKRTASRFCEIHAGGISAMPSSYSDRKLMAKMAAKPDKKELAERKLIAQINGTTSTVAGHSYAHGNSAVLAGGAKISGASVVSLSAIPNLVSDPVLKKYQDNIHIAQQNLRMPSAERINQGLALGNADAEQLANIETPEQKRLRLGQSSVEFRQREANQSHDFTASRGVSTPTPPGG